MFVCLCVCVVCVHQLSVSSTDNPAFRFLPPFLQVQDGVEITVAKWTIFRPNNTKVDDFQITEEK